MGAGFSIYLSLVGTRSGGCGVREDGRWEMDAGCWVMVRYCGFSIHLSLVGTRSGGGEDGRWMLEDGCGRLGWYVIVASR